jgi:hypothetical protein
LLGLFQLGVVGVVSASLMICVDDSQTGKLHLKNNFYSQVSHPYKITGRITVLYILTFTFLDSRWDDKRL